MPFRDAGYSQSDYTLSIQDVVYGVWRAKQERLFSFRAFNLAEYVVGLKRSRTAHAYTRQV